MTPPCQSFPATELPEKVLLDATGRRRKPEPGQTHVDLWACELLRMTQYRCEVRDPQTAESTVQCFPVDRLFRRCKDRKGTFMVETTAWEGTTPQPKSSTSTKPTRKPVQWSSSWQDSDEAPSVSK